MTHKLSAPAASRGTPEVWPLRSNTVQATVYSIGASLHDVTFLLGAGQQFSPFAEAPWRTQSFENPQSGIAPHLQFLGGEWPCVPFGTTRFDSMHHGYGSNAHWRLVERDDHSILLEVDFPKDHVIQRLRRQITLSDSSPSLQCTLEIDVRTACHIPIGLHPIFRLPEKSSRISLSLNSSGDIRSIPAEFRLTQSVVDGNTLVTNDGCLRLQDNETIRFPEQFLELREELIQVWEAGGCATLVYPDEAAEISLTWNPSDFPGCLLWLANPGSEIDGLGQFRGLGIEPVASFFDRGCEDPLDVSDFENKRTRFGVTLTPGVRWSTQYEFSAANTVGDGERKS